MMLCLVLGDKASDVSAILSGKAGVKHNGPALEAMSVIAKAAAERSLDAFDKARARSPRTPRATPPRTAVRHADLPVVKETRDPDATRVLVRRRDEMSADVAHAARPLSTRRPSVLHTVRRRKPPCVRASSAGRHASALESGAATPGTSHCAHHPYLSPCYVIRGAGCVADYLRLAAGRVHVVLLARRPRVVALPARRQRVCQPGGSLPPVRTRPFAVRAAGFGRIVASGREAPNVLANLV